MSVFKSFGDLVEIDLADSVRSMLDSSNISSGSGLKDYWTMQDICNRLSCGKKIGKQKNTTESARFDPKVVVSESSAIPIENRTVISVLSEIQISIGRIVMNLPRIGIKDFKELTLKIDLKMDSERLSWIFNENIYKNVNDFCALNKLPSPYWNFLPCENGFLEQKIPSNYKHSNFYFQIKICIPVCLLNQEYENFSLLPYYLDVNEESILVLVDFGFGLNRIGGSIFSKTYKLKGEHPILDSIEYIQRFLVAMRILSDYGMILSYHPRIEGGLLCSLARMIFSSKTGASINLDILIFDPKVTDWSDYKIRSEQVKIQRSDLTMKALFSEELGAILQIPRSKRDFVMKFLRKMRLSACSHVIGSINNLRRLEIFRDSQKILDEPIEELYRFWEKSDHAITNSSVD